MKSFMASPATIERKWYVVDATGYTLGRLSSEVAKVLRLSLIHISEESRNQYGRRTVQQNF